MVTSKRLVVHCWPCLSLGNASFQVLLLEHVLVITPSLVLVTKSLLQGGGGRVGTVVARRAIDLKVRGSSPTHGGSRIAD